LRPKAFDREGRRETAAKAAKKSATLSN